MLVLVDSQKSAKQNLECEHYIIIEREWNGFKGGAIGMLEQCVGHGRARM